MQVLLTFTGNHDPGQAGAAGETSRPGPVLSVVMEKDWDAVYLLATPRMEARTRETKDRILRIRPQCKVRIVDTPLRDPTNYAGIFNQLRKHFRQISKDHPDAAFSISVSSGTPHMHAAWLLLAASGEIPGTLLQVDPPEFVPEGKSRLREIDFTRKEFPRISGADFARIAATDGEDLDRELISVCREIGLIGQENRFYEALRRAAIVAGFSDTHVLLLGETGAGKEYFSKVIHRLSPRHRTPMVVVNCGSIPENLFESQLFGHKKGAFTGAISDQPGKFKSADGGILFLDEIGELPPGVQAKLLRALEQGEIEPLGHPRPIRVNVQVIAATNRDLRKMIAKGTFREDLYQRFSSTVTIPPLRERKTDIPLLATHLLDTWNRRNGQSKRLSSAALRTLTAYPWPGNVRELRKVIEQSAMFARADHLSPKDLTFDAGSAVPTHEIPLPDPGPTFEINAYLDEIKDRLVEKALKQADGIQARAARSLGWSPQALNQYLKAKRIKQ